MNPSKPSQNSGSRKDMAFSKFFSATAVATDRVFRIERMSMPPRLIKAVEHGPTIATASINGTFVILFSEIPIM